MHFRRKNIRLPSLNYCGRSWFFITLCCEHRRPTEMPSPQAPAWGAIDCLRKEAETARFGIHAFCVMPDHVHLLVEGQEPASDLLRFVKALKQKTGFLYSREFHERLRAPRLPPGGRSASPGISG